MAKVSGPITLHGSIGDISYYSDKYGKYAKRKSSLNLERIKKDPAFRKSRESSFEFGRASSAGKILRQAFQPLLHKNGDSRLISRLTREMLKAIQADITHDHGKRDITGGKPEQLNGFEFTEVPLDALVRMPYRGIVDRESGRVSILIPEFIPQEDLSAPKGTTHIRFIAGCALVNFKDRTYELLQGGSKEIAYGHQKEAGFQMDLMLPAEKDKTVFLAMGAEFYQKVNETFCPLENEAYYALKVISVNAPEG